MKRTPLLTGIAITFFACTATRAAEQKIEPFKLKNRSSFSSGGKEHDPFWPIGWVKPSIAATATNSEAAPATAPREVELSTSDFVLTSVLMGQPALAVINGREYAEGEAIPCQIQGRKIDVQIAAISDGSVALRYHDKNYTILIHRKGEEQRQIATTDDAQGSAGLH